MKKTDPELIATAIKMRVEQKLSLGEIATELKIGKTTVARYLKDYPLTHEEWRTRWQLKVKGKRLKVPPKFDYSGMKFGRLTVLELADYKGRHRAWRCICECGKEKTVQGNHLVSGTTKSCGRLSVDVARQRQRIDPQKKALNGLINKYKQSARKRKIPFKLSNSVCYQLFKGNCFYCGEAPGNIFNPNMNKSGEYVSAPINLDEDWESHVNSSNFYYNGIDRMDNNSSYTKDNCVSCCKTCNYAKKDMDFADFISYLNRVANFRKNL